ncbi:hypothetical protein C7999DRAFT_11990 [Corynascus novoguineensis]|uniref:Uncharacterized protein n=1 Tax=Corynascus novoguineensis TaxID=1126955 RepID=A0AAN7HST6_9PEZI|nr:hypothetical protein C7999DRAFT_11990 [Corynascus novoguineensis]
MCRATILILAALIAFVKALLQSHEVRSPLSSRQADGVPDASVFLRRAYHASALLNGRIYIDGGEFSYQKENEVAYEYCMTLCSWPAFRILTRP